MVNKSDSLFSEIQKITGCFYLSDLRLTNLQMTAQIKEVITSIPNCRYTLEEWEEAARYILNSSCKFNSILEVKNEFLKK